jgi:hypothetical protein
MSRQNKQKKNAVIAKQATAQRRGGSKGPSHTETKHGKVRTWSRMGRKVVNKPNHQE